jgi:chromosome segregation ATPase
MTWETDNKAAKETMKLQEARREFEALKGEEKKYLEDREIRAGEKLAGVNQEIETATGLLGNVTDKVTRSIAEYKKRFAYFISHLDFLFKRSDSIVDSAKALKDKAENLYNFIQGKYTHLQEFEKTLGEWDRNLVVRETEVNKLNKEADEKLAEAEKLADWANSGKKYVIKPKK